MDDIKLALLGDKAAQERLTERGELLEPCKRKGKLLRMTRINGKAGVYAVYAEDDLAGVVSGISQEEREKMLRTLREIC